MSRTFCGQSDGQKWNCTTPVAGTSDDFIAPTPPESAVCMRSDDRLAMRSSLQCKEVRQWLGEFQSIVQSSARDILIHLKPISRRSFRIAPR